MPRFRLSDGPSADVKRLHVDGTVSDIVLHRIAELPTTCARKPDNSPQGNYAVLWQTFAEQYPFFDLHKTDWLAVDREFRPQVTFATRRDQVFDVLRRMIAPLQDAHTGIEAIDIKKDFDGWRKDSNHLEDEDWKKAQQLIANRYLRGSLRRFCNGRVEFGMLDHSIGYLRITAFYGYVDEDAYVRAQEALRLSLDDIFRDSNKLNGLVIDVRLNHGGDDQLGIEIASRLTDRKYLAYAKAARNDLGGPLRFTAAQEIWVVSSKRPTFHGDVVLLIGPDTVSAGETFHDGFAGAQATRLAYWLEHARCFFPAACQTDGGFDCPTKSIGPVTERLWTDWACLRIFVSPFFLVRTWATAGTQRWKRLTTFFGNPRDMTSSN